MFAIYIMAKTSKKIDSKMNKTQKKRKVHFLSLYKNKIICDFGCGKGSFLINTINTPTLFIKGSKSEYITKEDELLIQDHFNNVIIKEIQNSGHWVHAEQTNQFTNEVLNFL